MPDYNFKNNLKSTLQSKLWSDATSIYCKHVVESEDADTRRNAWPDFPFTLTLVNTVNDNIEIIKCTSLANNSSDAIVFHCDRAQENTTAQTFEIATTSVEHRLTSEALNSITNAVSPATTTARGIGRVATSDDLVDGATINNGPAFLAAGVHTSVAAAAGKVPVADSNGKLDAWVSLAGKANTDLSNLEPAAEEVIRSKMTLRTLGTRTTTGTWTITGCRIGLPLFIMLSRTTADGYAILANISGAEEGGTGGYALGNNPGVWSSTNVFVCVPSTGTVSINVSTVNPNLKLHAKQ